MDEYLHALVLCRCNICCIHFIQWCFRYIHLAKMAPGVCGLLCEKCKCEVHKDIRTLYVKFSMSDARKHVGISLSYVMTIHIIRRICFVTWAVTIMKFTVATQHQMDTVTGYSRTYLSVNHWSAERDSEMRSLILNTVWLAETYPINISQIQLEKTKPIVTL